MSVENNPSNIELTQRALEKSHIANELVVAEDDKEALDYLFGAGVYAGWDVTQIPALVLLDLKLPRVDGLEVLRWLRGRADSAAAGGDPHLIQRGAGRGAEL